MNLGRWAEENIGQTRLKIFVVDILKVKVTAAIFVPKL
jgi:hypothetical protein